MFVLRLVGFLLLIAIASSFLIYLLKRDRRYLVFTKQLLKYAIIIAIIALAFVLFERLVMVV